jgi:hypothetical protein
MATRAPAKNACTCVTYAGQKESELTTMSERHTQQPEALRLADALRNGEYSLYQERNATEAELRRLHARVQELEASQAQRMPVQCVVPPQINQMLNRRMYATGWADCLRAHGITQEKQG